jgi:hypothetical protein
MIKQKPKFAFILALAGAALMFVNALLVGINGAPATISSSGFQSPNDVIGTSATRSWFRISFGFRGFIEGSWSLFWLATTIIMLYCAIRLYMSPTEHRALCFIMAILSILSITYGGGFIIGAILGVFGAGIGFAGSSGPENSLFYKIIMAAKLDGKFYKGLSNDENSLKHAAYALVLANILSGIGTGVYSYNAQIILNTSSPVIPFRTLFLGEIPLDVSIAGTVVINIGLAMLKWLALSVIIYFVAVGLLGGKQKLSNIASVVAFAYVPVSLQFVLPFILANKLLIGFTLPFYVFLITNIWMILALVRGVRQNLETGLGKTLGILSLSSAIYLLVHETIFASFDISNAIRFTIQPQGVLLIMVSSLMIGALLFETFTKH